MKPKRLKVAELQQDPRNARVHNRRNLDDIKRSLQAFGQQKPIVVTRDGVVIAGNGTLAAAAELGWETIHCVETALTPEQAKAYGIADNRSGETSDWDSERLAQLVSEISEEQLVKSLGFDAAELDELLLPFTVTGGGGAGGSSASDNKRVPQRDGPTVRAVFSVPEVATIETAIEATGERNRAQALLTIVRGNGLAPARSYE